MRVRDAQLAAAAALALETVVERRGASIAERDARKHEEAQRRKQTLVGVKGE